MAGDTELIYGIKIDRSPPQHILRELSYISIHGNIIAFRVLPCVTKELNNLFPSITMSLADLQDPWVSVIK